LKSKVLLNIVDGTCCYIQALIVYVSLSSSVKRGHYWTWWCKQLHYPTVTAIPYSVS